MATKPKNVQPQTPDEIQGRDQMYTPRYGVDIILPFIPKSVHRILEPAAGNGKIVKYLQEKGYDVEGRDINANSGYRVKNFLDDIEDGDIENIDMILTNPPFSIKSKFYQQCKKYKKPFGLLLPLDYSKWICDALNNDKCEKIIPDSRINYLTPNILANIHKAESKKLIEKSEKMKFKNYFSIPEYLIIKYYWECEQFKFSDIETCPNELLAKHSASQFHSGWFTWGLGLNKSETFVKLTSAMKLNI